MKNRLRMYLVGAAVAAAACGGGVPDLHVVDVVGVSSTSPQTAVFSIFGNETFGDPSCGPFDPDGEVEVISDGQGGVSLGGLGNNPILALAAGPDRTMVADNVGLAVGSTTLRCEGTYVCFAGNQAPATATLTNGPNGCEFSGSSTTLILTNGMVLVNGTASGTYTTVPGGFVLTPDTGGQAICHFSHSIAVSAAGQNTLKLTATTAQGDKCSAAMRQKSGGGSPDMGGGNMLGSGTYDATVTGVVDPDMHRQFVGEPFDGPLTVTVNGNMITVTGMAPFVSVTGTIDANGSFTATGTGTVAGNPNVQCSMTGQVTGSGAFTGSYSMGTMGELPGGMPITFNFTAAKQ